MWILLAEVSRGLQVSSASIKAAVSSLLDYDIFWDGSAQHEFLETIDDSVNQEANLIMLMTLAFKSAANNLAMKREPNDFREILSTVVDTISAGIPETDIKIDIPSEGSSVLVDYGYLAVGLRLLLEGLLESKIAPQPLELRAVETRTHWSLEIGYLTDSGVELIRNLANSQIYDLMQTKEFSPESILKLFTASQIFQQQDIQLNVPEEVGLNHRMELLIPSVTTN